ncbi:3-hydroxybutyryl-CoA dehydrogenase [Geothrix rubra]|uniref:3-hydroxybutyryl-CoA dehydrogenase n=1 Tax=Geothrix rubra TaxID=2927977 RepID=A0ABQ5Q3U5_9BACT|nr:3-hydroxybutyryl-CoA dehydrogenase [Geothrix rubra]GLH69353.1 3-hydroxybutyryl-CoA dehydrogenase [Geothrix rubra]
MNIQRIGIVGCGLMGAGIAQSAAEAGFNVRVKEVDEALLAKGLARIHAAWERALAKGKLTEDRHAEYAARLHGTLDFATLADCDLVIEAVPECLDLKLRTLAELDRVLETGSLLCSNTSSLSIAQLGAALDPARLSRLAGLHFFNPVPAMPLVEIVRTLATSEDTTAALKGFVGALGKTAVLAPDAPGFVVNRLLVPYLLDAVRCAEQRLATVEDLDAAMKLGAGHPMGPLHLSDFIGLDTMVSVADVFFEAFGEPRFKAPSLLRQLVAAGRLGRKSGSGFYRWEGEKRLEALPL